MSNCRKIHGNDGAALAKCLMGDIFKSPLLKKPAINHEAMNQIKPAGFQSPQKSLKTLSSGRNLVRTQGTISTLGKCPPEMGGGRCKITEGQKQFINAKGKPETVRWTAQVALDNRKKEPVAQAKKANPKRDAFFLGQFRAGSLTRRTSHSASSPLQKENLSLNVLGSGKQRTLNLRDALVFRPNRDLAVNTSRKSSAPQTHSDSFRQAHRDAKANGKVGPYQLPVDGQHAKVWVSRLQSQLLKQAGFRPESVN